MNYVKLLKDIVHWNKCAGVQKSELQKKTQLNMLLSEIDELNNFTDDENKIKELCDVLFVAAGYFYVSDCETLADTVTPMPSELSFGALMEKAEHQDMFVILIASKALDLLISSDNLSALDAVVVNNFSKFCHDKQELNNTLAKYNAMGVACNYREIDCGFVVYSAVDQHVGGKFFECGKILKNHSYKDCKLERFNAI